MDVVDRALEVEEAQRADALAEQRRALPHGESATHCRICDEPIPAARRAAVAGVQTCIDCQAEIEAELNLYQPHRR